MPSGEKSTNVRQNPKHVRSALRALSAVSPDLTSRVAMELFITPRRFARPAREKAVLAQGRAFDFVTDVGVLRGWSWGEGPAVMLVHGWEGRGAQLGSFVDPLVAAGYRVVTFDAPAHGESPGRRSTPPDFATAIAGLARWVGGVHAIVAHSMGATAAAMAAQEDLPVERLIFIGGGTHPTQATAWVSNFLDLSPSIQRRMQRRLAARAGTTWEAIEATDMFDGQSVPLLLVHDTEDTDVAIETAEAVQDRWPGAQLHRTEGLGHRRILRDPEVVSKVVDFIGPPPSPDEEAPWQAFLRLDCEFQF